MSARLTRGFTETECIACGIDAGTTYDAGFTQLKAKALQAETGKE